MRWAERRDLIDKRPHIQFAGNAPFKVVFFTHDEEEAIQRHLRERGKGNMAVLMKTLCVTGLRVGELTRLSPKHVEGGWINVEDSKNGRQRFVPIKGPLESALRAIIESGLPSYVGINKCLTRARKALGIDPEKTLHTWRHTAATRLTAANVPTAIIKDFLGHRSIATTLKYAHVQPESLANAADVLYRQRPALEVPPCVF